MATQTQENKEPEESTGKSSIFTGIILLLFGVAIIVLSMDTLTQIKTSQTWPTTEGVVVGSYVDSHRKSGKQRTVYYTPHVQYGYSVDGVFYANQQVRFDSIANYAFSSWANRPLTNYPEGKDIIVYYDPATPENAVLENSTSRSMIYFYIGGGLIIIGFVLFVFSLIFSLINLVQMRKQN